MENLKEQKRSKSNIYIHPSFTHRASHDEEGIKPQIKTYGEKAQPIANVSQAKRRNRQQKLKTPLVQWNPTVINDWNHRVGVTTTQKSMQPCIFLNRKLTKAKRKAKGWKIIGIIPVTMEEDRTWSEELMGRKGFVSERTLKGFLKS